MNYRAIAEKLRRERAYLAVHAFQQDEQVPDDVLEMEDTEDGAHVLFLNGRCLLSDVRLEYNYLPGWGLPFKSFRAMVRERIEALNEEDIRTLRSTRENRLVLFHHTMGRYLRNSYGLWNPANPYLRGRHPDDLSAAIILAVWRHVIDTHGTLPEDMGDPFMGLSYTPTRRLRYA